MRDVLDSHLNIETITLPSSEESSNEQPSPNIISACNEDEEQHAPCNKTSNNSVLAYANEVFSLGLLLMEFIDAVKEGDGQRILTCWKYMLLYHIKLNIQLKHFIYLHTIITYTVKDCADSYSGVVPLMFMESLVKIFPWIYTWNT